VRKDKEQFEEFVTKEGLVIEVKLKIKQTHVGYKSIKIVSIGEHMFAVDLEVFAKNRSELKYNLMLWKETLKKRNVNIIMEKT